MFSRRERLSRSHFPALLKAGRRTSSPHFMIVSSDEVSGYAVVIPKKVARLAVTRNRLRRRITEIVRAHPLLSPALIIFPRSTASSVEYQDMKTELNALLSKIGAHATIHP